jgi:flagellar biosynthetic protein FliP
MVAAMFVGMLAFGALRDLAGLTVPFADRPGLAFTLMATDMALGMGLWMWIRGHGAACTLEMCAAMYSPLVLLPLLWSGLLGAMAFMVLAHVVMMVAMLGVLLRHRAHPSLAGGGGRP